MNLASFFWLFSEVSTEAAQQSTEDSDSLWYLLLLFVLIAGMGIGVCMGESSAKPPPKQPPPPPCNFCANGRLILAQNMADEETSIRANYCPRCGRKLPRKKSNPA